MEFLDDYTKLIKDGEWEKALPLIEYIISLNNNISTSWFNYGVCLDALKRYKDATKAFIHSYQIDPENYGAQYRAFRSLVLANDEIGFIEFLSKEIVDTPDIAELLSEDLIFANMLSRQKVQQVIVSANNY